MPPPSAARRTPRPKERRSRVRRPSRRCRQTSCGCRCRFDVRRASPLRSPRAWRGRLEVELAVSETRRVAVDLGLAFAVAVVAAVILVTGLTVTLAAALAPAFGADWRPLLSAGGGGALLAAAALAWSIYRVRHLNVLRQTLASIKETWQWAERRL